MGLGDRVKEIVDAREGNRCGVHKVHSSITNAKEASEFIKYIDDHSIMTTVLTQACQAEGYDITASIIRYHRAGKCSCKKGK